LSLNKQDYPPTSLTDFNPLYLLKAEPKSRALPNKLSLTPLAASPILAAPQQCFDLVVIAQERHEEISRPVLKNETERDIASAFKELAAEFTNAQAAVRVRSTKRVSQVAQGQQTLHPFAFGQPL